MILELHFTVIDRILICIHIEMCAMNAISANMISDFFYNIIIFFSHAYPIVRFSLPIFTLTTQTNIRTSANLT